MITVPSAPLPTLVTTPGVDHSPEGTRRLVRDLAALVTPGDRRTALALVGAR